MHRELLLETALNDGVPIYGACTVGKYISVRFVCLEQIHRQACSPTYKNMRTLTTNTASSPLLKRHHILTVLTSFLDGLKEVLQVYRRTARELKRLGSLSISPIYQQFTETLNGLATIRAYQQEDRFMELCTGMKVMQSRLTLPFFNRVGPNRVGFPDEVSLSCLY